MDTDTVITVEHLHKAYGRAVAVEDVSFSVRRGEILGLLGPNGAGKTTTVECLQGLRTRDRGRVEVLGLDPSRDADRLRRRTGSQLQSSALPERLRVGEAVKLFGRQRGRVDVADTLAAWGLDRLRRRPYGALSGGQQQRVFLALALLGSPEVVFLDELTTGLDPTARRATWELVRTVRDRGVTVVLVTHFMEEAEALCDRVAVVDQGRVVSCDTPAALTARQGGPVRITFTANGDAPHGSAAVGAGTDSAGANSALAGGTERAVAGGGFDPRRLLSLPEVESVTMQGDRATVTGQSRAAATVAAALAAHGITPTDYRTRYPSLEDVFLTLTGHWLTEGDAP